MLDLIAQATGSAFELRVCAYEFHYLPVLEALHAAKQRGAKVRVIYDHRKENSGEKNDRAIETTRIKSLYIPRKTNVSALSHNKFIELLKDGEAQAVLTGGTNFSEGGILGHSNAVHIV